MRRKYQGDVTPDFEDEAGASLANEALARPRGIDPETWRRAEADAVRRLRAEIGLVL